MWHSITSFKKRHFKRKPRKRALLGEQYYITLINSTKLQALASNFMQAWYLMCFHNFHNSKNRITELVLQWNIHCILLQSSLFWYVHIYLNLFTIQFRSILKPINQRSNKTWNFLSRFNWMRFHRNCSTAFITTNMSSNKTKKTFYHRNAWLKLFGFFC